ILSPPSSNPTSPSAITTIAQLHRPPAAGHRDSQPPPNPNQTKTPSIPNPNPNPNPNPYPRPNPNRPTPIRRWGRSSTASCLLDGLCYAPVTTLSFILEFYYSLVGFASFPLVKIVTLLCRFDIPGDELACRSPFLSLYVLHWKSERQSANDILSLGLLILNLGIHPYSSPAP
ncbi:hypothetical protein Drorol1_Dr00004233, partial [Drosera rotundifolia]